MYVDDDFILVGLHYPGPVTQPVAVYRDMVEEVYNTSGYKWPECECCGALSLDPDELTIRDGMRWWATFYIDAPIGDSVYVEEVLDFIWRGGTRESVQARFPILTQEQVDYAMTLAADLLAGTRARL